MHVAAGYFELDLNQVELRQLVASSRDEQQAKAAAARSVVHLSAAGPVHLRGDPRRLRELVDRLLDNALKFGAGRPVELELRETEQAAVLRVVDHGPGVTPGDEERIFGRFQRAVSTRNFGGFGIGLWLARGIAQAHGGTVTVERTPGGGATFSVSLPR